MNLADAIRRAAQSSGSPLGQAELGQLEPFTEQKSIETYPEEIAVEEVKTLAKEANMNHQHESAATPVGHNVVRLELVLNPEQLKGFFGAVIASQHTVLTLREAANFLRISQAALEGLAQEGDVPGMMVDGKWRFTRPALEDWVSAHPKKKEA